MSTKKHARTVELVQAFLWTCDECGRDNFERGITISPEAIDPEDIVEASGEAGESIRDWIESGLSGDFVATPSHVKCRHCGSDFETTMGS